MNFRSLLSTGFVLVVISFFIGRFSSGSPTFLATNENTASANIDKEQQNTLNWMMQMDPLNFATYKYIYSSGDFEEAPTLSKPVKFFAGSYLFPDGKGSSVIIGSFIADLDGDGINEGIAMRMTNQGGTGSFPDLVVLKKIGNEFTEYTNTSEPISFFADRIQVKSVVVQNGIITVSILGHGPNDGACCSTMPMEMKFKLDNGKLVEVK